MSLQVNVAMEVVDISQPARETTMLRVIRGETIIPPTDDANDWAALLYAVVQRQGAEAVEAMGEQVAGFAARLAEETGGS